MDGVPVHVTDIEDEFTPIAFDRFVEGIYPLANPYANGFADAEYLTIQIALVRERMGFTPPIHVVWLDCIRQEIFDAWYWEHVRCDPSDSAHQSRRRFHLPELPANAFVSSIILASRSAEAELHRTPSSALWHRSVLGESRGMPFMIGSDFEASVEAHMSDQSRWSGKAAWESRLHRCLTCLGWNLCLTRNWAAAIKNRAWATPSPVVCRRRGHDSKARSAHEARRSLRSEGNASAGPRSGPRRNTWTETEKQRAQLGESVRREARSLAEREKPQSLLKWGGFGVEGVPRFNNATELGRGSKTGRGRK